MTTIEVGAVCPPKTYGPITRTDIIRYAGASGDFNPIHHDEAFAQSAGYPTVFSIGMFQAALLASYAVDWLGARQVRRFSARFKDQVWPGDELTCTGTVTAVTTEADGVQRATVDLQCARTGGGIAIAGTAEFVI